LLYGDPTRTLAKLKDRGQSPINLLLTPIHLRHDPSDATPVTCNDERFAPFHII